MKPFIVVQGPVATRSGYGNHTRDLVRSLIAMDKYDIKIISMPWGHCPMTALNDQDPNDIPIIERIARQNINKQPDIFIQVSVPNEFNLTPDGKPIKVGKYNIGVTAGVETTIMPPECIEGCNRMDMVICTSKFTADTLLRTSFDRVNNQTQQKEGELKCTTLVETLFEGADLNIYKKVTELDKPVVEELSNIPESFCFLIVGHWIKGNLGEDRKDIGMTIKTFCETFKNTGHTKRPALVLKSSGATFSIMDRTILETKISEVLEPYGDRAPNVYLLHGDLTDNEMNSLYNHPKIKAMVSFTKGEGYGRPLAEFSLSGKPILASNWSGHLDFLHKEYTTLLPGNMTQVHKSAADRFLLKEAQWFTVQYQYASKVMKDVFKHYKKYLALSRKQGHYTRTNFSLDKMTEKFSEILSKAAVPEKVELKLPKLNKSTNEPPKIKLPKLKKVEI
tara:strand:- start:10855 stop:12201 length:1347 start_codon:yes stop_codon:yes gene_type:complete